MAKTATGSSSLRDRILKNTTIAQTAILSESEIFKGVTTYPTSIPGVNIALSGCVDGGLLPGITMIAGPSKHFKTGFMLLMIRAFLDKHPNGIILFYDSEFGSPQSYFDAYNIPRDSIVHTPVTDIEVAKHDLVNQLNGLEKTDEVMICFDSIGNLASRKEIEDATEGKVVADMTRAKALKSLFRMITPHLTIKDIPFVIINHSYQTQEMYSKAVVSGGTGGIYSSGDIWILGRQQDKDGKELTGYSFIINIEKSRTVKEKSRIPITISFEKGIHRWSGLFDIAMDVGLITTEKSGWYKVPGRDTAVRRSEVEENGIFWNEVFETTNFKELIRKRFQLHVQGSGSIVDGEIID